MEPAELGSFQHSSKCGLHFCCLCFRISEATWSCSCHFVPFTTWRSLELQHWEMPFCYVLGLLSMGIPPGLSQHQPLLWGMIAVTEIMLVLWEPEANWVSGNSYGIASGLSYPSRFKASATGSDLPLLQAGMGGWNRLAFSSVHTETYPSISGSI